MKWNPLINALSATTYITAVVLFIRFIESLRHDTPDTMLDGMAALSLLVFSAAVMAFLFFYQPAVRLLDGKRTEAVAYFFQTLGYFGLITATILTLASLQ